MESKSAAPANTSTARKSGEKIIFEAQQLLLPTILNLEVLTIVGFILVILIAGVVFHLGPWEFVIIGVLYFLLALPSLATIFRAGSTSYVLTNQRLVIFTIGIGSKERSIPLEHIHEAKCKSSGLQRLYRSGDVIVYLKGLRRPVRLIGLKDCSERAEQIQKAVQKARG